MWFVIVALAVIPGAVAPPGTSAATGGQITTTAVPTATGRQCPANRCNDACASEIRQASLGGVLTALQDCSSAMSTFTITTSDTTFWVSETSSTDSTAAPTTSVFVPVPRAPRALIDTGGTNAQSTQAIPSYAPDCSSFPQYTSACFCAGAAPQTVTVSGSAVTSTFTTSTADTGTAGQSQPTAQSTTTDSTTESTMDSTTESTTDSTTESTTDSTTESTTTEPTTGSTTESTTSSTTEPTTDSTTESTTTSTIATTTAQSQPPPYEPCANLPEYPYVQCCVASVGNTGYYCDPRPGPWANAQEVTDSCSGQYALCCSFSGAADSGNCALDGSGGF